MLTYPTLKWPWLAVSRSVPQEVTRTVWYFWTTTETVFHHETGYEFSLLLLILMGAVGVLCYYLQIWMVKLVWRRFG